MRSGGFSRSLKHKHRITANKTTSSLQTTARPLQSPLFPDYFFCTAKAPPRSFKQPIFSFFYSTVEQGASLVIAWEKKELFLISSEVYTEFLGIRKSMDVKANQTNSLCSNSSRNPTIYCKATTFGDFSGSPPTQMSQYERIIETLTTLFPVWVILGTIIGIYKPVMVTWLETDLFTLGLGFLMLSMGLTLTFEDFGRCLRNPWTVGVAILAQYIIKPLLGFFITMTLKLSTLATGLILVSCCPGGQASNVATYISKDNAVLSVLMTTL